MGISKTGESAEQRFLAVTGARRAANSADGDAVLNGTNIEVKRATANTLNQVRAVKYIPLVAYHEPTQSWYVVPAHAVVCLVSTKARGQHTENPFESATLSVNALSKYRVSSEPHLKQATLEAIAAAERYPRLKQLMAAVLRESKSLAAKSIAEVQSAIAELGVKP